jgi:DNA-binding Lrp family transcriptional regulator
MKAFVLVNVRTGSILEVVRNLRNVNGVTQANMTFGPYDAVVTIEAQDINHLGRLIATEIHPIPGVLDTITCLVTEA